MKNIILIRRLTLENLSTLISNKLSYFLDATFKKSRTFTAQEKKNLRKITIAIALDALGLLLSYSVILDFEKCVSVSTIEFTDKLSEEESMGYFLQFIADNFDHNEDTTTGAFTTHVMGLISSKYPKSNILSTQPIMK